jgi:hypothetical protein
MGTEIPSRVTTDGAVSVGRTGMWSQSVPLRSTTQLPGACRGGLDMSGAAVNSPVLDHIRQDPVG